MDTNLLNNYVLKAIDAYPYDLEETVENLNYALSYEANNIYALYLMGRLQAEQLGDYEKAKQYYAEALANKMDFVKVYPKYISVLIWNEDYDEAKKLIEFAFTVKGLNKGEVWLKQGHLFENLQDHKKAIKALKIAKSFGFNNDFISYIDNEISRIKAKLKPKRKKKKKKKKK
ncbi:tetratricopeptide repeat protein [Sabulilitoribacter arenilitoris]|uniref:Tetratricopeptide repeat protein n=1 Tax=Wocania arenilitoris TaxID=2044858 RepID=A0AAE3JL21_9FLAO|nr:tetratricopeptide repeat protein [Wocania arenilitoris]MCF7568763.1 tetratricopeptide repeat protein [Wocania arenilitoris]